MKVLLVTKELGYRGTPKALANYAFILSRKYDVSIWGYETGGETRERLVAAGFKVYTGMECLEQLLTNKPDVVNIHRAGVTCKVETGILGKFKAAGCKCIETNVFGRVDWSVEPLLDLSIQISLWDLYRWNAWKGGYKVPGVYVPYPVNVEEFKRASSFEIEDLRREWLSNDAGEGTAFVLGRIGKTKWEWLAGPLNLALKRFPNLHFVNVLDYCGESMPDFLKKHPRVHNQKRLVGVKELVRFYSSCDACVNMSWNGESFGYVNAEPMACGTPVIALSTPLHDNAQVEMLGGENPGGIVIGRPTMLGEALDRLIGSGKERIGLGRVARESIVSRYSDKSLTPVLSAIFEAVSSCDAGEAIRQASNDGRVITAKPRREIEAALQNTMGGVSLVKLQAMRFYHSNLGYEAVCFAKRLLAFLGR